MMEEFIMVIVALIFIVVINVFSFKNVEDGEFKQSLRGVVSSVGMGLCILEIITVEVGWFEDVPVMNQVIRLLAWVAIAQGIAEAAHAIVLGLKQKTEDEEEPKEKRPFYKPAPPKAPEQEKPGAPTGNYNADRVPAWKRVEMEGTDVVICPQCGTSQRPDRTVCYSCGTKLRDQ